MQTVLVVGGSGFIGQHVTRLLVARGHTVFATQSPGRQGCPVPGARWLPCDLTSPEATVSWPSKCDAILFLAQARQWREFPEDAAGVAAVNIAGLLQAVRYAQRVGARRFLYASTGSVYPCSSQAGMEHEPIPPAGPRNFYVASKLAGEVLLGPYGKLLTVVTLRLFVPYGPGQHEKMLFPQLLAKIESRRPVQLHAPDGLLANPVAIWDVAEACLRCLELTETTTLNLAGPEIVTLRQIAEMMGRAVGLAPLFEILDEQPPPYLVGNTATLASTLKWAPSLKLEAGIRRWMQERSYACAG